jgi:hypothetical protein
VNDDNKSKVKAVLEKSLTSQTLHNMVAQEDEEFNKKIGIREDCLNGLDQYRIY